MVLRLALRNVRRNVRRTILTVSGIALALALMMTSLAMNNGMWGALITTAIQASAGHVVVQANHWQDDREPEQWVTDSGAVAASLREAWPEATVVRRTFLGGLLTSPTNSTAITLQGVEAEAEATLTLLDDRMREGTWLDDDDRGILLGDKLAETLGVTLGDKVVFMTQAGTDDLESRLFRVKGLFHTGNEVLDAFGAIGTLAATQELMPVSDPAHQVAVILPNMGKDKVDPGPAEAAVAGRDDVEVLAWSEALPLLEEQFALDDRFSRMMYGIMGIIVAVGVLNTVLMSVMERVREFGVMRALGMKPAALFRMIMLEGLVIGLIGGFAGLALATPGILALHTWGIDYGDMIAASSPIGSVPIETVMRASTDWDQMLVMVAAAVVLSVLAAIWPAWKATTLRPVEAIHHR